MSAPTHPQSPWVETFLAHVLKEVPNAPVDRLTHAAFSLQVQLGDFDPVDVAEAEWYSLPLGSALAESRQRDR